MIVVKNLTKVYKTKHREVKALDNVSFTLPDKGMVFIVGKSGSGKSTLLNMISGLDKFTSGKIIAGGNSVEHMSGKTKERYLSSYIGYIFQDYRLIEDFTVKQNVALAADISGTKNDVSKFLSAVGLSGYENRLPKELSGGQKQRVSIARALIKNPMVILADEPTGNLDKDTTKEILDLLKAVSKDTLVVVVSHNLRDADAYADRIIELADGRIIHDKSRIENYDNSFKYKDGVISLPHHKDLTNVELGALLRHGRNASGIVQGTEAFAPTEAEAERKEKTKLHNKGMSLKNSLKIFFIFFKRKLISKSVAVFLAAVLLSVFYVVQAVPYFNVNTAVMNSLVNMDSYGVIIQAGPSSASTNKYIGRLPESKIQKIDEAYDGNIYRLYSEYMYATTNGGGEAYITSEQNTINFYTRITTGALNTTEAYACKVLGVDKLTVLAGDLYDKDYGVVITDYTADSIIHHMTEKQLLDENGNEKTKEQLYLDIIGERVVSYEHTYINAIVDTNYEEEHREIKDVLENLGVDTNLENLVTDPRYLDFKADVSERYNITYSFSENYYEALCDYLVMTAADTKNKGSMRFSATAHGIKQTSTSLSVFIDTKNTYNLKDGQVIMGYTLYNSIFGKNVTADSVKEVNENFSSQNIRFTQNESAADRTIFNSIDLEITGLTSNGSYVYVNEATYREMLKFNTYTYSLYLDDPAAASGLTDLIDECKLSICSGKVGNVYYIKRCIGIFVNFLYVTQAIVLVACIFFLVSFGIKSIRSNIYEIGVIKAMGGIKKDISKIFISQSIIIGIGIIFVTYIGMHIGAAVANDLFINTLIATINIKVYGITAVDFYPLVALVDIAISIVVVILSAVISTASIDRLNLLSILKAKE